MKKIFHLIAGTLVSCTTLLSQTPNCPDTYDTRNIGALYDTLVLPTFTQGTPSGNPPGTGFRPVFWLHGLGGNTGDWGQVQSVTESGGAANYPARKVHSFTPDYSGHTASLRAAGQRVYEEVRATFNPFAWPNIDTTIGIIIAHSQGGIVARELDIMYDNPAQYIPSTHGIVTFGSPHAGARILTNIDQISDLLGEGCSALLAGPAEERIDFPGFLDIFINEEAFIAKLDSFICQEVLPIGESLISGDYKVGTTKSFCDTCSYLEVLNSHQNFHSVNRVAFYGIESGPELLRTLHFFVGPGVNDASPFEANYDSSVILKFDSIYQMYRMKESVHQRFANIYQSTSADWSIPFFGLVNSFLLKNKAREAQRKSDAYQKGADWLASLNEKYVALIGGRETVVETGFSCECEYMLTNGKEGIHNYPNTTESECAELEPPGANYTYWLCTHVPYTQTSLTKIPNDGVVTAPSAMAFPGAGNNKEKMSGSNHFQMRNDRNTKDRLMELWTGKYGPFFITDEQ